ncbi:MAG TPA: BamA/TamA family outer membrane protein [Saprospiraceae bacterium]|nr:BamA/TamA family outer membrane protein [Saprospiraceae bacterium]
MKILLLPLLFCGMVLSFFSCASVKPYYAPNSINVPAGEVTTPTTEIDYSLYLVGGISLKEDGPVLKAIESDRSKTTSGLVLLGDVLSPDDLSSSIAADNSITAYEIGRIKKLDDTFKDLYLIPGQKEWTSEKKTSPAAIIELDRLLKNVRDKGRLLEPRKGCGSPEVVRIAGNTIVVLMDSQWAIESEARDGEKLPGCELGNVLELKLAIKDIIQSHPTDHIILATHHPVYANGIIAGNYPLSSHLLPVPVLGTLITGIRSLLGSDQHFGHPSYEAYRATIISATDGCDHCIIVSGHEKNLQYYERNGRHYFVAGSGDKVGYARKGEKSGFSYMSPGFLRADVMHDGALNVSFIAVDDAGVSRPVWQTSFALKEDDNHDLSSINSSLQANTDSILIQASTRYEKKKFLRGEAYRKAWSEKIKLPVLWIDHVHGGLTPLQLGGGNQTRSLRLENAAGEQYVLRSIDKRVTTVLPPALRGTFAENLVQEGIASSHPYGALVVPRLAIAAGVFYSIPCIVYVPHQSALGIYNDDIGDGVYLFEERPGGKTSGFDNFGNTEETFNTLDVIEMVKESHKNVVDQKAVLRARLFDTWLGDWDRHDDQVRWASFRENDMTVFRPIPRDRDQVFFKNDGLLDYLGSRPYFNPALRRFQADIDYLPGLIWAGKFFDRSFLHELTEEDFVASAKQLQASLTDKVIDAAFLDWPRKIDSLDGKEIRSILRARRDHLVDDAREYYRILSKVVAIPGSEDPDIFTVDAIDDHHVNITVERKSGNGTLHVFYHRVFDDEITKEIQLFGLDKDDIFRFNGTGNPTVNIRIVGGTGEDQVIHDDRHLDIIAYDVPEGMSITGKPVKERFNTKPFNNTYDRTDYKLNKFFHFPAPTFYTDEGLGLTYNVWFTRFGFRTDPFKSRHALSVSYFFKTQAFIGKYSGDFLHAIGDIDLGFDAFITAPTFTQYFYGLGNEYINYGQDAKYHIVKGSQVRIGPSFNYRFGFGNKLFLKTSYQFLDLEDSHDEPRFVFSPESQLTQNDFGHRHYAGISAGYEYRRLDNNSFPSRGGDFEFSIGTRTSLSGPAISHGLLSAGGTLYIPLDISGVIVLATHLQADKILGDYEFFHALTLGGPDRLRGFRTDRFAGDSRFYQNTDLRLKLFRAGGMLPFSLGVFGSFDYGRVWYKEADADTWHVGFGGGIFVVPLGLTAFRIGYMSGEEDNQLTIGGSLKF